MTFSCVPADQPVIWMQFVPAREDTASPAANEKVTSEGMVHFDMARETPCVETTELQAREEVSTLTEKSSAKTAGPHISSVDRESQMRGSRLAECEYHRDCISVGKRQADRLSGDTFDSLILATTTGCGRDAVVVGMRTSAGQFGSPVDCLTVFSGTNNLPKEFCLVAGRAWNERLRCPKTAWLYCPSPAADSDELGPPPMTRIGPRRSDRVTSSQRSSNLNDDSKGRAASLDSRLRGAASLDSRLRGNGVMKIGNGVMTQRHNVTA